MTPYFVDDPNQPRVRRATDVVGLIGGLLLLVWAGLNHEQVSSIESALVDLVQSFPTWFEQLYRISYFLGFILVVALFVSVIAQGRKRLDLLRDMVLALVASVGIALGLVVWLTGELPLIFPELSSADPEPLYPVLRVAAVTSVIAVAGPHLTRPVRRFAWALVVLVGISGMGLGFGFPSDAVGGVGLGLAAASSVLLVFGSPRGYPDVASIRTALAELGVRLTDLTVPEQQSWGVRILVGTLQDGGTAEVKALGRDAADSQVLSRAWRGLWYREQGQAFSYSRLHGVEHEALAILMAQRAGVGVEEVLAVGVGGDDVALLATTLSGGTFDALDRKTIVAVWRQLSVLHGAGIAHGRLTARAVTTHDGRVVLRDFAAASFSASDARLNLDVVSLLAESAADLGAEAAVAAAAEGIGVETLTAALPYLQEPALTRDQRKRLGKTKSLIKALRDQIVALTGVEPPEPAKLRRVNPKDLLMPALSLIAAYALIGMLSDIDFVAVWEVVRDATWVWIVVGFVIGQFVFFPEATGMMFAVGYPLPLMPLTVLQVSVKWIGLAVPSAAGRVAMNTVFLRKYGVSPTIALTQGAIDGIAGFLVEALILITAFVASDLTLDLDTDEVRWGLLLGIVVLIIVATVVVVLRVRRVRTLVVPVLHDAWGLLWGIMRDPKRTFGILGSNLASRLILGVTLWFILQAIGTPLPLVTCLVVTVATNLLAGLVPVPGGIGIAEAVLTSFLVLAGLGSEEAFAAAVVFRVATFYIPAGEGFFAMKWLETNGYI